MAARVANPPSDTPTEWRAPADRSDRLALIAFGVVLVVALVLFLVLGRHRWFFLDEWDFLVERRAGSVTDLLRPHNEHWSTVPILAYRVLYGVFGLRTYVPYQLTSILLHLTVAVLVLVVIRRSGVRPWIATAAASLFALFGTGSEDIVWAFQMAWSASLVFGLTHLILADHDGPVDRRDWLGIAAGLAGLLCSGVAVAMTIAVGIAVLIRRGWRLALLHTAPLGAVYVLWWLTNARDSYGQANAVVSNVAHWAWIGTKGTFDGLGQVPGAGIALGVLLVAGLVVAWWGTDLGELRRRAAAPAALLVGALAFLVISGVGRASALGPSIARQGRYMHVLAALTLPALAVAADALVRRWRLAVPVVAVLLVIGIPGNIEALSEYPAVDHTTPGWVYVDRSIVQSDSSAKPSACGVIETRVRRHLKRGQSLFIRGGPVRLDDLKHPGQLFEAHKVYYPDDGGTLTARTAITLVLSRPNPAKPVKVCALPSVRS
jgi:hypothetical protein